MQKSHFAILLACLLIASCSLDDKPRGSRTQAPKTERPRVKLLDVGWKVIEKGNTIWTISWKLTIENQTAINRRVDCHLKLLDDSGFAIEDWSRHTTVNAGDTTVFTQTRVVPTEIAQQAKTLDAQIE